MAKKIWARVGMSVEVSDEQYERIKAKALDRKYTESNGYEIYGDYWDDEVDELFMTKGVFDGDCYIPSCEWEVMK